MTEVKESSSPMDVNLNPGETPKVEPADQLGSNFSAFDMIYMNIETSKADRNKKHKSKQFKGFILTEPILITRATIEGRTGMSFVKSLDARIAIKGRSKEYWEYIVYIPEVSGCYPGISMDEWAKAKKNSIHTKNKKDKIKALARFKFLDRRLNRFPKFYIANDNHSVRGSALEICRVEFPDEEKLAFGRYIGRH